MDMTHRHKTNDRNGRRSTMVSRDRNKKDHRNNIRRVDTIRVDTTRHHREGTIKVGIKGHKEGMAMEGMMIMVGIRDSSSVAKEDHHNDWSVMSGKIAGRHGTNGETRGFEEEAALKSITMEIANNITDAEGCTVRANSVKQQKYPTYGMAVSFWCYTYSLSCNN